MRITKSEATIRLNDQEASDIAYSVFTSLLSSIEKHYNCLQQNKDGEDLFFRQESSKLHIMATMYAVVGNPGAYDSVIQRFRGMFRERRVEREKETDPA